MVVPQQLHVLAIVNGDPSTNAGARLRVANWVESLPSDSDLQVRIERRPRRVWQLLSRVRRWLGTRATQRARANFPARNNVIIVQKAYSLELVALLIYLRLRGVAVIQDICDPPYKVFNPEPFGKSFFAVFYLSLVSRYLVDHITVSSSVLARSFSSSSVPVTYIRDCIDFRPLPVESSASEFSPVLTCPSSSELSDQVALLPPLHLLWFGGAARLHTHSGIEELYAATPVLMDLASRYRLRLSVCTILDEDTLPVFEQWARHLDCAVVHYYLWSLHAQQLLLNACDLCFLPRLQSLATFYKSANRIVLAAWHGRPTLCNLIPSDDHAELSLLLPSDLLATPGVTDAETVAFDPPPFPPAWTAESITRDWEQVLHTAHASRLLRPKPLLPERILLGALLFLLIAMNAVMDARRVLVLPLNALTTMLLPRRGAGSGT